MVNNYGIKPKPITTYNSQSNGIIERVHLVLADALRTAELDGTELDEDDPFGSYLASAAYAIRSTYHTTLKGTPAQLVYGRDMIFPLQHQVDWAVIAQERQKEMKRNNQKENSKRREHDYKVDD